MVKFINKLEILKDKIHDSDEKVRRNVVETVCNVILKNSTLIDESLLKLVGERMRDKKDQLREHTIELFIKLYQQKLNENLIRNKTWQEDEKTKFIWIPEKIFQIYHDNENYTLKNRYLSNIIIDC
jgi:hypothetical protein